MRRRISGEVVQGQPFCIGKNRPRLTFDGDGCRLNHCGGTAAAGLRGSGCRWIAPATAIRATPGSCGATAGGDKHYYEDAKSEHERAFKKHCIFSLNVSTKRAFPSKRHRLGRHCTNWPTTRTTLAAARKSPLSIEPPKAMVGTNHGAGRPSRKK